MDRARMIAAIVERFNVRLDPDDPTLIVVELNRLALEQTAESLVTRLAPVPEKIQAAGRTLAKAVAAAAVTRISEQVADARMTIAADAEAARRRGAVEVTRLNERTRSSHVQSLVAWSVTTVVVAAAGFGAGYYLGRVDAPPVAATQHSMGDDGTPPRQPLPTGPRAPSRPYPR